jgi:hypothetical protein
MPFGIGPIVTPCLRQLRLPAIGTMSHSGRGARAYVNPGGEIINVPVVGVRWSDAGQILRPAGAGPGRDRFPGVTLVRWGELAPPVATFSSSRWGDIPCLAVRIGGDGRGWPYARPIGDTAGGSARAHAGSIRRRREWKRGACPSGSSVICTCGLIGSAVGGERTPSTRAQASCPCEDRSAVRGDGIKSTEHLRHPHAWPISRRRGRRRSCPRPRLARGVSCSRACGG